MKKINILKVAGITATVMGMASTALSSWVSEATMKKVIAEKVAEEVAKHI